MLSSAQLAAMQAAVSATLDQSCQVQRNTTSTSNWATQSDSWSTHATVNVSLAKPSAAIAAQYADLIGSLATWVVRLPYGTSVLVNDRLVVGGQTLKVQALLAPRSYPVSLLVLAAEVQ